MTDEDFAKLANDCTLAAKCMEDTDTFPTGQAILREAALALLDARAERDSIGTMYATVAEENKALETELDRLRADAQAAVALVVERAAEEVDRHYAAGDMGNPGHWVRALAPADGLAAVEALRSELEELRAKHCT